GQDLCQHGVIHVIPAIPACPVRPESGYLANARFHKRALIGLGHGTRPRQVRGSQSALGLMHRNKRRASASETGGRFVDPIVLRNISIDPTQPDAQDSRCATVPGLIANSVAEMKSQVFAMSSVGLSVCPRTY